MKINLDIESMDKWLTNTEFPFIIAGPCSAESEEQLLKTARELALDKRISVFRAGIWKPRTRPNSFDGVGEIGLEWMKNVKKETGLKLATEVASPEHVEACLKAGIDYIWIGARTTVNPFSVQAIADVLKGVDIPVLIKNPINPDLQLWIGAIERINQAGIKKIIAIHRGFSCLDAVIYRNSPQWSIPIELKVKCPDIPIICDPSHIAGNKDLIYFISQKAFDLDMDGLIIESHISPPEALSDAHQQITPSALKQLLSKLVIRDVSTKNAAFNDELDSLRKKIDEIDETIFEKISERMKVAAKIGEYKYKNKITVLQIERWKQILENRINFGEAVGLNPDFMKKLLQLIHQESIRIQLEIMNDE